MIGWLASALERPLVIDEPFQRLDAIVVLGAPLGPGDRMTQVVEERVDAAAALWRAGGGSIVVATGGKTRDAGLAEADVIAEALAARGIPDVVREGRSRSTAENARFTAALIEQRRVWLVTQPFHGRRAARLFRAAGFEPHVWHIAESIEYSDRKRAIKWLVREYASWGREMLAGLARR